MYNVPECLALSNWFRLPVGIKCVNWEYGLSSKGTVCSVFMSITYYEVNQGLGLTS